MSALERPLDTVETVFAIGARHDTCGPAVLLGVTGDLDAAACARAVASLPARHPRLRTRVVRRDDEWAFTCDGAEPPPFALVDPHGPEEWPRLLERVLARRMDDALPSLAGVTLAPARRPGAPHALVVWGQHAALDFRSMLTLAHDVAATSAGVVLPRVDAVDPLDARLPPRAEHAPAPDPAPSMLPFAARAPASERRERVLFHVVPAPVCRALLARAREAGATLAGILTAAALEALRGTWGALGAVKVATSVSARSLADPPVPPDAIGCFVSVLESVVPLDGAVDPWLRARACSADIRARIERGEWSARLRALSGRLAAFERQVEALVHDEGSQGRVTALDVVNFGALELASIPGLRLGPVHAAVSNQGLGHCLWIGAGSVDGELQVSFTWVSPLVDEGRAQAFLAAFARALERAVTAR